MSLVFEYNKRFPNPELGGGRITFLDQENKVVYKIPKRNNGISDNIREEELSKNFHNHLAKCEIINPGETLPILKMELLDKNVDRKNLPDWAYQIEHFQVGVNSKGEIKAYDLY